MLSSFGFHTGDILIHKNESLRNRVRHEAGLPPPPPLQRFRRRAVAGSDRAQRDNDPVAARPALEPRSNIDPIYWARCEVDIFVYSAGAAEAGQPEAVAQKVAECAKVD